MRKTTLQIFASAAVLSAVSAVSFGAHAAPDETLKALAGYRQWASARGEPARVTSIPDGTPVDASAAVP
ncbi:MAG TPA: hypothetical protein VM936_08615 [Pyrinomonadaceae bacterium]|jgi:hypothetical protein|nr:hypothetical protein [Pyrinomonadaceae bacterium]